MPEPTSTTGAAGVALVALLLSLLTGCSTTQDSTPYTRCVLPYDRPAGLGVVVPACHAWLIGPDFSTR